MHRFLFLFTLPAFSVVCFAQTQLAIAITAVANSADFQPGLPQHGSLASIFCTGLTGNPGTVMNTDRPLTNHIGDVSVWINFRQAPVLSITFGGDFQQINVQVPWEGQERDPLYVEVFQDQQRAHTEDTPAKDWSVFFADANGYGVVQHASDYSPVTRDNPAHAGEYLIAYGINLGPQSMSGGPQDTDTAVLGSVVNAPASGYPAPLNPLATWQAGPGACGVYESVTIGNVPAPEQFDGLAPGAVGVYQVNFQVPAGVSGDVPLAISRNFKYGVFGECTDSGFHDFYYGVTSRTALVPVR